MAEQAKPDPKNEDAHAGAAGEGYSDGGSDAWYHEDLLLPDKQDDADALAYSRKRGWTK